MAKLPTFKTKATDAHGNFVCDINMDAVLLSFNSRRALVVLEKLANGQSDYGHLPIYKGMPRHHLEGIINGPNSADIYQNDLHSDAKAFFEQLGGSAGFRQFSELNRYREQLERKKDRLFREMVDVNAAAFILAPASKNELLYDDFSEKFADVETLLMQYRMPKDIFEMGDNAERHKAFEQWVRVNGRPYAWDTIRDDWKGLTVDDVLGRWDDLYDEDDEDADPSNRSLLTELIAAVKADIECQLDSDHYEDAYHDVVDIDGIDGIVTAWFDEKGDLRQNVDGKLVADQNLKKRLAKWGEKQSITSYHRDSSAIVGLHPDVTEAECKQFLEREFSRVRNEIDKVENMWRLPLSEGVYAVTEKLEPFGIWLTHGSYDEKYHVRSTPADLDAEFPTLEMAFEFAQELVR